MPHAEWIATAAVPLGWYYGLAATANLLAAAWWMRAWRRRGEAGAWVVLAVGLAAISCFAFAGRPPALPEGVKLAIDSALGPVSLTLGSFAAFGLVGALHRFFARPAVGWTILNTAALFLGVSLADPVFASVVTRPDNVPIVAMVFLLGFFAWLALYQAVRNDERMEAGQGPVEADYADTVLVWPDVVYLELIGMVIGSIVLIVWSLALKAPLEAPANPVVTPNPSKAPWYFLGLQEMLVYFPPSIAGVILPVLIIVGLMAIPYLDVNPKGSGYYTIRQRPFAWVVYLFGFLMLWILLILIGTFLRGPNWSFFGLYEPRDPHKVFSLANVSLARYFWEFWLGVGVPQVSPDSGGWSRFGRIVLREAPGLVVLGLYFLGLPVLLARTVFRPMRRAMGRWRYAVMVFLLLLMLALPLKMILVWTLHLSYVVDIPEYSLQF